MGLIESRMNELLKITEQFESGTMNHETVKSRLDIIRESTNLVKMIVAIKLGEAKFGKKKFADLYDAGIIGGGSVVSTQRTLEMDMINCPELEKHITRSECLDYSGDSENVETCHDCPNFKDTRAKLIPSSLV